jgi:hypothetical protein
VSEFLGEHEFEPVRGLPEHLPPGETLLWQGTPSWKKLATHVFHVRAIGVYFALIALWRLVVGVNDSLPVPVVLQGMAVLALMAAAVIGFLTGYAALIARTTVYTITDRRVVIRGGIAMPKTWNLPFGVIRAAAVRKDADGGGDLSLELSAGNRIAYLMLWPYAKPWRLGQPQPLLRGLRDVRRPAEVLGRALAGSTRHGRPGAARPALGVAAHAVRDEHDTSMGVAVG